MGGVGSAEGKEVVAGAGLGEATEFIWGETSKLGIVDEGLAAEVVKSVGTGVGCHEDKALSKPGCVGALKKEEVVVSGTADWSVVGRGGRTRFGVGAGTGPVPAGGLSAAGGLKKVSFKPGAGGLVGVIQGKGAVGGGFTGKLVGDESDPD